MSPTQRVYPKNTHFETSAKRPTPAEEADDDDDVDSSGSEASFDEEGDNRRLVPHWASYRAAFKPRGFRLDTIQDVKARHGSKVANDCIRYLSSQRRRSWEVTYDDDALCPDVGLVSKCPFQCCSYCAHTSPSLTTYSEVFDCVTGKELS